MPLSTQLTSELSRLSGLAGSSPQTVSLSSSDPDLTLDIDFLAVDSMSCAVHELRLNVPSLTAADFDVLKAWAAALASRVTYLLENIGPLEFDPDSGTVLIRSTTPSAKGDGKSFYEILLQSQSAGHFTLRRFESVKGQHGRTQVNMHLTHEVLKTLVDDLAETVPQV